MKLSQLAVKENFIGLFVGKNGCGKSCAAASFAELGPLKLYDLDKRARGILGQAAVLGKQVISNIDVEAVDARKGWAALDERLELDLVKAQKGNFPYKTVVFESASTLQKMLVDDSQRLRKSSGKQRGKIQFWHPDDYNYSAMGFHQFCFNYVQQMPCNVIITGWMVDRWGKPIQLIDGDEKKDDQGTYADNQVIGEKIVLTDKLSEEVPGYFDEIYCFEKDQTSLGGGKIQYTVTFESTLAKTCHPSLRKKKTINFTDKSFYLEYKKLVSGEMASLKEMLEKETPAV